MHVPQAEDNIEHATSELPLIPPTRWNLREAPPDAAQSDFQSFSAGVDFSSMSASETPGNPLLGTYAASFPGPQAWPLSLPNNDTIPPTGWQDYPPLDDRQANQVGIFDMSPLTLPESPSCVFSPTEDITSLIGTNPTTKTNQSTHSQRSVSQSCTSLSIVSNHFLPIGYQTTLYTKKAGRLGY